VNRNNTIFDDEIDQIFPRPNADIDDIPEEYYEEEKTGCYL